MLWQSLTFDPIQISAAALGYMSRAVHDNLVRYGEGAELRPGLAERWEVLEQGLIYRFYLRRDVRFHNGSLFNARDVHDNFVRLLSPESKSSGNWILRNVAGADDVIAGRSKAPRSPCMQYSMLMSAPRFCRCSGTGARVPPKSKRL